MTWIEKGKNIWLGLLLLVLASNFALYQTSVGARIIPTEAEGVVIGSLLDFAIVAPILFMLYRGKFSWKMAITLTATGCILIRLMIPSELLAPFANITLIGIAAEVVLVFFELLIILTLVRYLPKILQDVKSSSLPVLFSFHDAVKRYVKHNPMIQMICAEGFMLYYALFSWKKPAPSGITLYKNSSFIAFQVMMIHAIIVETLGIHYFLHAKWPIVSIILLVLNVYSIFFFLGDLQALRLNPVQVKGDSLYISLGLMKRAKIDFAQIACLIEDKEVLQKKRKKDTLDFVVRDFETVYPDFILKMKVPQKATMFMGIVKEYDYVAIKSDDSLQLKELIFAKMQDESE